MPNQCDNKSVGVIIRDKNGRFVLIKRKNYPIAYAFVAGHIDNQSPEDAALAEVREEASIQVSELKEILHERFENPCKREGGSWHEWWLFEAVGWEGNLSAASDAKEARWVSHNELVALAGRTRDFSEKLVIAITDVNKFTQAVVEDPDWQANPGLEPTWVLLLEKAGIL